MARRRIDFLWWNAHNFSHYVEDRRAEDRWPISEAAFREKLDRVGTVITRRIATNGTPAFVAIAEVTRKAATALRDRVLPTHRVEALDLRDDKPDQSIAVIYDAAILSWDSPIVVPFMSRGTRPMAVLDLTLSTEMVRFIACHWTAFDLKESQRARTKTAFHLGTVIYDYLHDEGASDARHVVVVGDLNTEPHEGLESDFYAHRSRQRVVARKHYTDKDQKRVRLYNCGWRLTGESRAFSPGSTEFSVAGTFYSRTDHTWRTFDHLIVSAGLIQDGDVNLLENEVQAIADETTLCADGYPRAFAWNDGNAHGVSDHLPLVGSLSVKERRDG